MSQEFDFIYTPHWHPLFPAHLWGDPPSPHIFALAFLGCKHLEGTGTCIHTVDLTLNYFVEIFKFYLGQNEDSPGGSISDSSENCS